MDVVGEAMRIADDDHEALQPPRLIGDERRFHPPLQAARGVETRSHLQPQVQPAAAEGAGPVYSIDGSTGCREPDSPALPQRPSPPKSPIHAPGSQ